MVIYMGTAPITIDGSNLTLSQLEAVSRFDVEVGLSEGARKMISQGAAQLDKLASSDQGIYGVNTGFGVFADRRIDTADSEQLSYNLILSHASGMGRPFPAEVVRAAMLIRANSLARGHSGVRPALVETLLEMLNQGVVPVVPSQGSLGSSGDLAPLAHMALTFVEPPDPRGTSSSGRAWLRGKLMTGAEAMQAAGIKRPVLGPKEGLALTNGATFTAALVALAIIDAGRLESTGLISGAMSFEALLGDSTAFNPALHEARNHPGQIAAARDFRACIRASTLVDSSAAVQDAYSLRCIPQVHAPARELLPFVRQTLLREINASTDNPLILNGEAISGGNFHGQILGNCADYLKLPMAEIGLLSERRVYRLMGTDTNRGLPPMLVADSARAGLESGLMMLQYTAASLVLENESLSNPDSVRSLPTSAGQEDLNANSTTAARRLRKLLLNLESILAIEILAAGQALDLRRNAKPGAQFGETTTQVHSLLREVIPFQESDQPLTPQVEAVVHLLRSQDFLTLLPEDRSGTS